MAARESIRLEGPGANVGESGHNHGAEDTPRPVLTTCTDEQVRGAPRDRLDRPAPLVTNLANRDQSCLPMADKNSSFYTGRL